MYLVLDTETSGLPRYDLPADDPAQPRLASLAMILCDDELRPTIERYHLVKPDGWECSPEALAVNGLSQERLEAEGIPVGEALGYYLGYLDRDPCVLAYGCQFDLKVLRGELRRAKLDDRFATTRNACVMRACVGICKLPQKNRGGYRFPKLHEAFAHFYKNEFDFPHTALGDARACLEIARFLKRIDCLPDGAVHHAKEGTKAGRALAARRGESTDEATPASHMPDDGLPF